MKNIAIAILMATGLSATAQVNQNVTKESTTTTVRVNDGSGTPKTMVRTQNTESVNELQLKDAESKELNKEVMETPAKVTSSTSVVADSDFNAKIGQISNYQMGGKEYTFVTDKTGYRITTKDNKEYGKLRKLSNGQYIFRSGATTSVGRFDRNGNFVVETYDDKTDGITVETYMKVAK